MEPEDFFSSRSDGWTTKRVLDTRLIDDVRSGSLAQHADLDVAIALTKLLYEDLVAYGTGGGERMQDEGVASAIKAHRAVVTRLGLEAPRLPFRHFSSFYDYWRRNGMSGGGGYQARRDCIEDLLGPVRDALEELEELEYQQRLRKGPTGAFKNLIFAADGPKPELVLRDAVSNDVEIVRHAESCLVYTDPLPPHGLSWRQLVTWWITTQHAQEEEQSAARALYSRLSGAMLVTCGSEPRGACEGRTFPSDLQVLE